MDNDKGNGTFICGQCGAGDGIEFLKRLNDWDFHTAASEVDKIVGGVRMEPQPAQLDPQQAKDRMRDMWRKSVPIVEGSLAWKYLRGRNVLPGRIPESLRFMENCPAPGGQRLPAMLALIEGPDGIAQSIHRTFLGPDGKANMTTPRALMPGKLCDGASVRLYPHKERLGIAEGIETAIAAAKRFQMPVWAAINANMLARWVPPAGVSEVVVFGDCDQKFGGQAAAYALAHRLAVKGVEVTVSIPEAVGMDWADVA